MKAGWRRHARLALALVLMAGLGAAAQHTKRLAATPPGGLPWEGCADLEGYVADDTGTLTVQSARCKGRFRAWLLRRASGEASERPIVIDELSVRALRPGEMFSAGPYCTLRTAPLRWLAIYEWRQRKRIDPGSRGIVEAWIANARTDRFESASRAMIGAAACTAGDDE